MTGSYFATNYCTEFNRTDGCICKNVSCFECNVQEIVFIYILELFVEMQMSLY